MPQPKLPGKNRKGGVSASEVPWQEVWEHVKNTNPHKGTERDAAVGMSYLNKSRWVWHKEKIQPKDPRIDLDELNPASRRDVRRYAEMYSEKHSAFPPVVLLLSSSGKLSPADGAHRLQAALDLGVPIDAYVGVTAGGSSGSKEANLVPSTVFPDGLPEIVQRALVGTVTNLGQITKQEQRDLDKAVRKGLLSKGKGGPYPVLKTVYARPGFDFHQDRLEHMLDMAGYGAMDRAKGIRGGPFQGVTWQQTPDFPFHPWTDSRIDPPESGADTKHTVIEGTPVPKRLKGSTHTMPSAKVLSQILAAAADVQEPKVANAFTRVDEAPIPNAKLQEIVGDPDTQPISWSTQTKPATGATLTYDPNSPLEGDEVFFSGLMDGSRFADKNGEWWSLENYDGEATVTIRKVWYPRVQAVVSIQDIRRSIHAWIEPFYQIVPPPPAGVDYGVTYTREV